MIFSSYYSDFLFVIAELTFIIMVILSLLVYTVVERNRMSTKGRRELSISYSVSVYFIMILFFYLIISISSFKMDTYTLLFNYSLSNAYGMSLFKIILTVLFLLIFYAGISEYSSERLKYRPFEANYILGFVFIGMLGFLHSFDFISLFLTLELQNFSLYILMNIQRNKKIVVETCIKYYIIGGISSGLILYGISLIYGFTGKVNLFDLILFFTEINVSHFGFFSGLVFLFCGFFIKLGIAPFHFWVPQIYDGAPNFITLILLTVPKFVLFIVFMKLYLFVFGFLNVFYIEVLWVLVILSFFFGSIGALWQNNVKRFLAYSSITNSGFILLSFSLFTYEGLYSGILYLVIYVFSTFGIFYIFLITRYQQSNSSAILDFKSFSTVRLINPTLSIMLSINLLSVAGIPPLSGFISKFFIFKSVIESDFSFILIPLIIFSLISAYYYIRPIKLFFFNEKPQPKFLAKIPYSAALIVTLIFYFNVCMIIQPRLLLLLIEMAISSSLI